MHRNLTPFILAVLAIVPGTALAHASLTGSSPVANATVKAPATIVLRFDGPLIGSTVKTDIVMTGMPGMADHAPMPIAHSAQMARDGKSMKLTPRRALVRGTYRVSWSAAGADTHRTGSNFSFTVR